MRDGKYNVVLRRWREGCCDVTQSQVARSRDRMPFEVVSAANVWSNEEDKVGTSRGTWQWVGLALLAIFVREECRASAKTKRTGVCCTEGLRRKVQKVEL